MLIRLIINFLFISYVQIHLFLTDRRMVSEVEEESHEPDEAEETIGIYKVKNKPLSIYIMFDVSYPLRLPQGPQKFHPYYGRLEHTNNFGILNGKICFY